MIQLKMKSKRWWIGNKSYHLTIPQSWAELRQMEILKVMKIIMTKGHNPSAAVPQLITIFGKLPKIVALNLTPQQYVEVFHDRVLWVFSQPLIIPLIPIIHHKGNSFFMCAGKLADLTIEEYIEAEKQFLEFYDRQNVEALDLLCAIILREVYTDQKILKQRGLRVEYNDESVKIRAKFLSDLEEVKKFYVLYFFLCCRAYIAREYFDFDPKAKKGTAQSWDATLIHLAETRIFGNLNEVKKTKAHDIFHFLNQKKEEKNPTDLREKIRKIHQKHLN
jgi:hypothetical protein